MEIQAYADAYLWDTGLCRCIPMGCRPMRYRAYGDAGLRRSKLIQMQAYEMQGLWRCKLMQMHTYEMQGP
jgi:hypothetical protein